MRTALGVLLMALTLTGCSTPVEQTLLSQFFAASRLRDLTALQKYSTVVFEPARDGIVTSFEITSLKERSGVKYLTVSAPVELPNGQSVVKSFAITIQGGLVTAISEEPASPSTPRP